VSYGHEKVFFKGVLSGIVVGLAATGYLAAYTFTGNKIIGGLLFSFALVTIVSRNYALYTGRIGYLLPKKPGYLVHILKVLLSNIVGVAIIGLLVKFSGIQVNGITMVEQATNTLNDKLVFQWYQTFILSIFCGILMYIGVDSSKKNISDVNKIFLLIGSVILFLVASFEHSIATLFYLFLGNVWSLKMILYILIMIVGNAVGGIFMNLMHHKIGEDL